MFAILIKTTFTQVRGNWQMPASGFNVTGIHEICQKPWFTLNSHPGGMVRTFIHEEPIHLGLWGLIFSVLGDVQNWDSGQTQA